MEDTSVFASDLEKHKTEIKNAFMKGCVKIVLDKVRSSLDSWKETTLNIGVTGRSGVGKSTLINTIRGLSGECPGAAESGVTETTCEPKPFRHPQNENVIFWDLPGIGTENFSRTNYFTDERVQFDRYDMFLILSSGRFYEDDLLLAEAAQQRSKLFFFIRTKVDNDVQSAKRAKPSEFRNPKAMEEVLGRIRHEVEKGLSIINISTKDSVFLIDCLDMTWNSFDFGKLINRCIDGFDDLKRQTLILTLNVLQADVMEKKVDVLKKRIWKVSLLSAAGAAIPLPGISIAVDCAIILEEALFYMSVLGISYEDIEHASKMLSTDITTFNKLLGLETTVLSWTLQGMKAYLTEIAISEAAEIFVKFAIPFIGVGIASATSFSCTYAILRRTLNMIISDAKKLNIYMLERARSI